MKKTKIILSLFLMISCLFLLTGCKSSKNEVVKIIDIKLTDESYAFAVKKGNNTLLNDFDNFLNDIKEDGQLDEIITKYINDENNKVGVPYSDSSNVNNDDKTFVVATNCPFEPFEYISDGYVYGIDIEIAKLYADSRGLNLVIKNIDFDAILPSVDSDLADIGMAALTVDSDRLANYDFTQTYYEASQKVVVHTNNHDFDHCQTKEDVEEVLRRLDNEKVGYQGGTTGNWYVAGDEELGFEGFDNLNKISYKTGNLAIDDLAKERIYVVVLDEAPAYAMVKSINSLGTFGAKWNVFKKSLSSDYFQELIIKGLFNTLIIAVCGLLIGIVIGTVVAITKVAPKYKKINKILDKITSVYVAIFRGTPIVVQLLLMYYVLFPLIGLSGIPALMVAVIVFGLNSGAYVAEIMRGGINSVDKGQMEAGRALGMGYWKTMFKIVVPQAIKNILPTLGNEFISLIKETSVVSFISVADLYKAFNDIGSNNYEVIIPYCGMALIYVGLIVLISVFVKSLEKGLARSDKSK